MPQRVAIIGGGITGLAAAHRIGELLPSAKVTVLEAAERPGGILQTDERDGYLIERAADMFSTKAPWAWDLCQRIGFDDELIGTNEANRGAFVVHRGELQPVPQGFTLMSPARMWPVLKTPLLSWRAKARLACERFIRPKDNADDESLEAFATRRVGREVYEHLVQPLIGGIYTADPTKLSVQAAMPEFVEMEREYGSLTRAVRQRAAQPKREGTGARYGLFFAPRRGMSSLVDALVARLPEGSLRLGASVERIELHDRCWRLTLAGREQPLEFQALIIATATHAASALLASVDSQLARDLNEIPYASAAIPVLGYRRDQIEHPLNGFGFVVPFVENRQILSVSFASVKFPGRAPDDSVLLRVFIGGACQGDLVDLPDEDLYGLAERELAELLGVRGQPQLCELVRWRNAMPQYHLGHLERVTRIEERAAHLPSFSLAGNGYRGVGIPFCIHSGEQAAEAICRGARH